MINPENISKQQKIKLLQDIENGKITVSEIPEELLSLQDSERVIFFTKASEPGKYFADNDCTQIANPKYSKAESIIVLPTNGR